MINQTINHEENRRVRLNGFDIDAAEVADVMSDVFKHVVVAVYSTHSQKSGKSWSRTSHTNADTFGYSTSGFLRRGTDEFRG